MYLIDTNVISELRKQARADPGVRKFFQIAAEQKARLYISAITIGELRRGVELIRYRGDLPQASLLENWLQTLLDSYSDHILDFTEVEAQVWGCLCAPHTQNAIDKQIAAIALTRDLILVTRNVKHFADTGVSLVNPFEIDISA